MEEKEEEEEEQLFYGHITPSWFAGVTCLVGGRQDGGDRDAPGPQLMSQSVHEEVESSFRRSVCSQTGKWQVTCTEIQPGQDITYTLTSDLYGRLRAQLRSSAYKSLQPMEPTNL